MLDAISGLIITDTLTQSDPVFRDQITKVALAEIEALLAKTGSSKDHLLMATIWLADMADFDEMNAVWDEWIAGHPAPARATCEAKLFTPEYRVEIIIVAAKS